LPAIDGNVSSGSFAASPYLLKQNVLRVSLSARHREWHSRLVRGEEMAMPQLERIDNLVLGGGNGGKHLAWHMARSGRRTAVVERRWIGGSCPNINCLPSKNEIWSAKVADLVHHAARFGTATGSAAIWPKSGCGSATWSKA
jgi:hypothetical protein